MFARTRITEAIAEIESICESIPGAKYHLKVSIPGAKWEHTNEEEET